jgi:hypothetical protein
MCNSQFVCLFSSAMLILMIVKYILAIACSLLVIFVIELKPPEEGVS